MTQVNYNRKNSFKKNERKHKSKLIVVDKTSLKLIKNFIKDAVGLMAQDENDLFLVFIKFLLNIFSI